MDYRFERTGTAAVFTLEGRIDSAGSIDLDRAAKDCIGPADLAVLFDMGRVPYISSAGIRVFSGIERMLRQRKGHVYLCSVQPAVGKVIALTGFDRIFSLCASRDEALSRCSLAAVPAAGSNDAPGMESFHTRLFIEAFPGPEAVLAMAGPNDLSPRLFNPDEYSAGIGVPGESATDCGSECGLLATLGGAIFWKPFQSRDPPEFLIPRKDAPRVLLQTSFSIATGAGFHEIIVAEPVQKDGFCIRDLFADILRQKKASREIVSPLMSVVLYAATRDSDRTLVSFGTCLDPTADLSGFDPDALAALGGKPAASPQHDPVLHQYALLFDASPSFSTRDISRLVASAAAQESCTDLTRLSPDTQLSRAVAGIRFITGIVREDTMPVTIRGECPVWNRTYETITRWLHPGCRELELTPLSGGFSGTLVFRVRARDSHGRLMMPLVMKLGSWPLIEAEIRGYTDHVKRYIQNNATQIIETERIGDYGGILYNFVGIRGEESSIFSLEDFYLSRAPADILPVFDSLFRVVLNGWYGEPRKKEMALYKEYNRFWKYDTIRSYAHTRFGADPDQEEIGLPFGLGRSANPLYFVEKVMPGRKDQLFSVYESSVHGDLNMKNVLMDETKNLWLIDFAETRYSHILRDIVKLEAVIKGEMVPLSSREDLADLVRMDVPFLSVRSLSEIPVLPGSFPGPALEKAFRVVRNLRQHADRITPGDDDIAQYYLGLLPYTLNLLSYSSVDEYQKEYGWIASSLICRQLMNLHR